MGIVGGIDSLLLFSDHNQVTDTLRKELESSIQDARKKIALGAALERLMLNRDFKLVVLQGYLADEAIRLVHEKAVPGSQTTESQQAILRSLDAIGTLKQFLNTILTEASLAEKSVNTAEEVITTLQAEESDNV